MDTITVRTFLGHEKTIQRDKFRWRPAAYGIVLRGDMILLVKMIRTGQYVLPGGGIELGETSEEALRREMQEETGIEIKVAEMVEFLEVLFYYDPSDTAYHTLQFYYRCDPLTFVVASNDEVEDGEVESPQWVSLDALSAESFFFEPAFTFDLIRKVANI